MPPITPPQRIVSIHSLYCALTGLQIRLDMHREYIWFEYFRRGLTEDNLRAVVKHIKTGILNQRRNPGALRFSNLVAQFDRFEEELAEASAFSRPSGAPRGGLAEVLRATGRAPADGSATPAQAATPTAAQVATKLVSDPAAAAAALAELRRLKESL
jgi:hypothetical protein